MCYRLWPALYEGGVQEKPKPGRSGDESTVLKQGFSALTVRVALVHPDSDPKSYLITPNSPREAKRYAQGHTTSTKVWTRAALRWEPRSILIPKSAI